MFKPDKVKVIVWDVDGTWYRNSVGLVDEEIKQRCLLIADLLKVSFEEAVELEEKTVKDIKSHTKTVSKLTGLSIIDVLNRVSAKIDRSKFLMRDEKLIKMFEGLKGYRQVVLSNMRRESLLRTMEILGLDKSIFDFLVLPDETGVTKPDLRAFKMVLEKTGLKPSEHLFVGDREEVDIVPAKRFGMQTCFVWGKSKEADISIGSVYGLSDVLCYR